MMGGAPLTIVCGTRRQLRCRMCGEPIVLARRAWDRSYVALEAHASGPKRQAENGVLLEDLPRSERHVCSRRLVVRRDVQGQAK